MDYELWMILLNISSGEKIKLIDEYKNCKNVYDNFEDILNSHNKLREKLKEFQKDDLIQQIMHTKEILNREGISFITYENSLYRDKLKGILSPPFFLFFKGNIEVINSKSMAMVGARKYSNYGLIATKVLTKQVITNNITLISGGARGIDSIAHKTALELEGKNICVLGCGIDRVYPRENKKLFSEISKKGVVISEFLPGTPPLKMNFPKRNRIISGLSDSTVVIEAGEKSGSLITARYAIAQKKRVIVVPGSIFYKGAAGSNKLLMDKYCVCCADVEDFKFWANFDHVVINDLLLSDEKQEVLKLIGYSPTHMDAIINNAGFDRGRLYALLFEMQMKGEVICLPGNYYVKAF